MAPSAPQFCSACPHTVPKPPERGKSCHCQAGASQPLSPKASSRGSHAAAAARLRALCQGSLRCQTITQITPKEGGKYKFFSIFCETTNRAAAPLPGARNELRPTARSRQPCQPQPLQSALPENYQLQALSPSVIQKNSLNFLLCEALSCLNHFSLKTGSCSGSRVPSSLHCTQHGQASGSGYHQIANTTGQQDAAPKH